MAAHAPGTRGEQLWIETVEAIFQGDREMIEYVQRVVGMAAIGEVYQEALEAVRVPEAEKIKKLALNVT